MTENIRIGHEEDNSTKISLEIRKSTRIGREKFWVVDVLPYNDSGDIPRSYITKDGSRGSYTDYPSKQEALAAARLSGFPIQDEPETSAGIRKETNPKDIIGMKKAPISTLSCAVLFEMGLGMLEGARKYGRHNYRAMGVSATVYYDAAIGHLMDWFEGEDLDPDTGLCHITKALTALVVLRDSMLCGNWTDDRPLRNPNKLYKKSFNPKAAAIIEKYPDAEEPYLETRKDTPRGD